MGKLILAICIALVTNAAWASSRTYSSASQDTRYAIVEQVEYLQADPLLPRSAVMGGVVGAIIAGPRHRRDPVAAAALAGATYSAVLEVYGRAYSYQLKTTDGDSIHLISWQADIYPGDCIALREKPSLDLRRMAQSYCATTATESADEQLAAPPCSGGKLIELKSDRQYGRDPTAKSFQIRCAQ